ncbi:MAG: hypothetical protein LBK60_00655 [Verrucomicrobiales bacterium]|jgi:plasmid stabilization system protein ParE|nr:hypothetical protein [Verrucomicrobiales bacterium]
MNGKPIHKILPVADDLDLAILHYLTWRDDGEEHFLKKYNETLDQIEYNPAAFPVKFDDVQGAILERSYYIVYYVQEPKRSVVLAVLDGRRNPCSINRIVRARKTFRR